MLILGGGCRCEEEETVNEFYIFDFVVVCVCFVLVRVWYVCFVSCCGGARVDVTLC